jgi:protein-L-isoaspartate(D-aspartate) O-methyltransferase
MGIQDKKVLDAINNIPRHFFIDSAFIEHAYQNKAFPIGHGQTISHPYTVAFQTERLDIQKTDKVLEIGTGSGYQTCILALLSDTVFTIERIEKLGEIAQKKVEKLNLKANFTIGDGTKGLKEHAPFDKIIVTAGAPTITEELINQLAPNGKLIIPVGDKELQVMHIISKSINNDITQENLTNFQFVPLIGENAW